MPRLDTEPVAAGMLSPPSKCSFMPEHILQMFAISDDRISTSVTFTSSTAPLLHAVSPDPRVPGFCAFASDSSILRLSTADANHPDELAVAPDLIGCGWLCDSECIFCASAHPGVDLLKLRGETLYPAEVASQALRLAVHTTELCTAVYDRSRLTSFDFGDPLTAKSL
jgi:hypothetical protein